MTNISIILIKAYDLLDDAQVRDGTGDEKTAIKKMAELRKYLNEFPELETRDKCEPDEPSNGS